MQGIMNQGLREPTLIAMEIAHLVKVAHEASQNGLGKNRIRKAIRREGDKLFMLLLGRTRRMVS